MSAFERQSAYDGCTSKLAVGVAFFWPIVCLEVADLAPKRMSASYWNLRQ
jgi:hypothetical protein